MESHKTPQDDRSYHTYESHPMPWWLALIWLSFFIFALTYLFRNLLPG